MNLPTGTVTFLFTDIAGSARLWQDHPETMPTVLARHDVVLRDAIQANNGFVVKTIGDAFMAVFSTPREGLAAAWTAQRNLCREPWPVETPVRVRMGLHAGAAEERDNDYYGHEVNRAARIQAVVHPEQIVVSQAVYERIQGQAPDGVTLLDLGLHQLKDMREPEPLWQVCHPDLPAAFPPLNSLTHCPNNLPRQLSSFVGREKEIAEVQRLLAACSCLTLVGSGGGGKTRLALQVAAEALPDYPHGVWLVELAALTEPSFVPQMVAAAMGLREESGKTLMQTLTDYARTRTLLLMLDNCEHLLAACAQLVNALLRACPQIKILTTSREPLNIVGEQVYRVPVLTSPDLKQPQTPQTLPQYEATRLFIERAMAVKADFVVTDRNAPELAQICHRLDGIPLAIELAAARVRSLSVEDINNRLNHRFRMLTGGSRSVLPRQQTLQALIDWSYDLLNDPEKFLLARLAVFAGGWTLETAEQVCCGEGIEDWEVLDLLTSLTDKSLVLAEEKEGSVRYRMLETVREYAAEKLKAGGEEAGRRRGHMEWYLALAEEAAPLLRGPEQGVWLERLESEHDNLRSALTLCLSISETTDDSLRFCVAMKLFWLMRGHLGEGRAWCESALTQQRATARTARRARTLNVAASLAGMQGDLTVAKTFEEESLAISREIGDRSGIAGSLVNLGNVAYHQGDYAAARTSYKECLAICREIGDCKGIASVLANLGNMVNNQGDNVAARSYLEESLALSREIGDHHGVGQSLNNLGNLVYREGDHFAARTYYEESLAICRAIGDQKSVAIALGNLGSLADYQNDYPAARTLYEEGLAIAREIGDRHSIARSLNNLSNTAISQGDYLAARARLYESLAIRKETGDLHGVIVSLESSANLAFITMRTSKALAETAGASEGAGSGLSRVARLWGVAQALRERLGVPLSSMEQQAQERDIMTAREILGEAAWAAVWAEGRALTMEQAIAYALEDANDPLKAT